MDLEKGLKEITAFLATLEESNLIRGYALIGGFAVSVWGQPRATQDIDFLCAVNSDNDLSSLEVKLREISREIRVIRGDAADPVKCLIRVSLDTAGADLLIASRKWEEEALEEPVKISYLGVSIPVVSPEYLVILKLKAGGPRDLYDVQTILETTDVDLEGLKELGKRFRVDKKLEKVLARTSGLPL